MNIHIAAIALALSLSPFATAQSATLDWASDSCAKAIYKKIDANGRATIKHEAIASLDMPAMTMKYKAGPRELAWLSTLEADARIEICVAKIDGQYTLIQVRNAP